MRKIHLEALAEADALPDDGILNAKGVNGHGCKSRPFCGATDVHSGRVQISAGKPDFAVKCEHCDCIGPWAITAKLATQLWNDGFQSSRPPSGRRTRKQSQPTTNPARGGSAD